MTPKTAVVVIGIQGQVQTIIRAKVTDNVGDLNDPQICQPDIAQGLHVLIGDGCSIQIHLQRIVQQGSQTRIADCASPIRKQSAHFSLVGF